MNPTETPEEKAQRLHDARQAAAKALFDEYEKWNDRGTFLSPEKPFRCSTHNEQDCCICHEKPRRRSRFTRSSTA